MGAPPGELLRLLRHVPHADGLTHWMRTATNGPLQGTLGEPITLTVSFVPDGTLIESSNQFQEPAAPSNLRQVFNGLFGSPEVWQTLVAATFERWGDLAGVRYSLEPNDDGAPLGPISSFPGQLGVRGDIRIGGKNIDGFTGFNLLAYNYPPDVGDMVIDTSNILFFSNPANGYRALRNVVAHEHGHGLGLDHTCPINSSKLMEPAYSSAFDGPQLDDVRKVQRLYGDRFEQNDTASSSSSLGTLVAGTHLVREVSTDGSADDDWYHFSVTEPSEVDVVLRPVGATYLEGPELPGLCAGSVVQAANVTDLAVEITDGSGQVLATANAAPAGLPETVTCVVLPPGQGPYRVHVQPGPENAVQLYELEIVVRSSFLEVPSQYPSIQAAIAAACDGETVRVAPGTYDEVISFLGKNITVVSSQGPMLTTINSSSNIPIGTVSFQNGEMATARLEGFTISRQIKAVVGAGIYCDGAAPTIVDCLITGCQSSQEGGGVWVNSGSHPTFLGCSITHNTSNLGGGIHLRNGASAKLSSCVIAHNTSMFAGGGVQGPGVGGTIELLHCTVTDNQTTSGFGAGVGGNNVFITNSIVWGNVPVQIEGNPTIDHSNIQGGMGPGMPWAGVGNIDAEPYFADPAAGDYHLSACSPSVDAGDGSIPLPALDVDGEVRVRGNAPDLGADETDMVSCAFLGTQEDLILLTGVNGLPTPIEFESAMGSDIVSLLVRSPGGSLAGLPYAVGLEIFPSASPPAGPAPGLHLTPTGVVFVAGLNSILPGSPLVLPLGGASISFGIPPGLAGQSLMIQGAVLTPTAQNGAFASTNGHEVRLQN